MTEVVVLITDHFCFEPEVYLDAGFVTEVVVLITRHFCFEPEVYLDAGFVTEVVVLIWRFLPTTFVLFWPG